MAAMDLANKGSSGKKRKEKTLPFGVNLVRSQVLYQAAQVAVAVTRSPSPG